MPHLILPHASAASDAGAAAIRTLDLPNLSRLLARLTPGPTWGDDEYTLNVPHEAVLADLHGWNAADGRLPFAAHQARADGVSADLVSGPAGWGQVTPCHWLVGADKITLLNPSMLELDETESRALLDAVRPSFEAEGWTVHYGAPLRWYVRHAELAGLSTASLDRVIGRNLELWLRGLDPQARRVRRLQVEAQMLWHGHAVNETREERGALPVNSFWLSGTGAAAQAAPLPTDHTVDARLREPLMSDDWASWCAAWKALDDGPVAELLTALNARQPCSLTLCGERRAQRFDAAPVSGGMAGAWQRWRASSRRVPVADVLGTL